MYVFAESVNLYMLELLLFNFFHILRADDWIHVKYTPPMGFFTSIYSTSWRVLAAEIRRTPAIQQAEVEERRYSRDRVRQLVYCRCQWHSLQVYCLLIHWNAYRYVSDTNDITSLTFIRIFSQSPLFKWFILVHRGALSVCSAEMKLENFLLQTWPMAWIFGG